MPNSLVDLYAQELGSRGVYIYVLLARCTTRTQYPSVRELATWVKALPRRVEELLAKLHSFGLLNDSDLDAILESRSTFDGEGD